MSTHSAEEPPRVLVLGAQGALGSLVVGAFESAGWTVAAGSRRPNPPLGSHRVDLAQPDTVAAAVAEVDVVVNTVPDEELTAERIVLENGGALVNVSALPATAASRLRALPGPARGAVLMNAGVAPGITNLIAADLLARYPTADEVEMVFTVTVGSTAGPAAGDFAHRGLTARSHHHTTRVPLPAPFGQRRCLGFAEPDAGWLGPVATGKIVRSYVCFAERSAHRVMLALNDGRMIGRLPRAILGSGKSGEATQEPVAHWVAVLRQGTRLAARTLEGAGDFLMASASSVLFADALLGRDHAEPATPGVWNPEELRTLDELTAPLQRAGITVTERGLSPVEQSV